MSKLLSDYNIVFKNKYYIDGINSDIAIIYIDGKPSMSIDLDFMRTHGPDELIEASRWFIHHNHEILLIERVINNLRNRMSPKWFSEDYEAIKYIHQTGKLPKCIMEKITYIVEYVEGPDGDCNDEHNFEKEQSQGFVYVIRAIESGHYKIGLTRDLKSRIQALNNAVPNGIKHVLTISTKEPEKLELELHNIYANKRINGEWFILNESDIEYIESIYGNNYVSLEG